jgi:selenocysteine lyase/cysteine desulfurase
VSLESLLLGRRDFLVRTGLVLGAAGLGGAVPGCDSGEGAKEDTAQPAVAAGSWAGVRAQFDLDPKLRHFSAFYLASHPRPVREAIERHRSGLDADPAGYLHENQIGLEGKVVQAAASYLGARAEDFALTDSTTMGLGLLYSGIEVESGQEILTTEHDFYSTHETLRLRAERDGVNVRRVRLYDQPEGASEDEIVSRLIDAVRPATRIVAITWVHSGTGVKLPVASISSALAERRQGDPDTRLLLCVDAVHALGAEEMSFDDLGCDFVIAGCHKWLFGPRGTGIVWGADDAWPACTATIPSFTDTEELIAWIESREPRRPTNAATMTPGGFHSFEHRWALAEAFDFQRTVGMEPVAKRTRELAGKLKEGLAGIASVTVHTPKDEAVSAGLVTFELDGQRPDQVVDSLRSKGIVASVTPYAAEYVRLGTTVLVSEDDVYVALREIAALA